MTNEELQRLTAKFLEGTLSQEEQIIFNEWWRQGLQAEVQINVSGQATDEEEVRTALLQRIKNTNQKVAPVKKLVLYRMAAACVLLLIGVAAWWYVLPQKEQSKEISIQQVATPQPGGNKAILTLSDGSVIILDSASNGLLATETGHNIIKKDGQILYAEGQPASAGNAAPNAPPSYNTMSTPRGGQYQLRLPDGSEVWLNASSSIRYPTIFGEKREVETTGELYFEIAKDKTRPFIVKSKGQTVEVLGTNFNINAYNDEPEVNTTLVEGSVKILSGNKSITLTPNQTGITDPSNPGKIKISNADISRVLAWRNGYFRFQNTRLPELMRQLARWYDLEVSYQGPVPATVFNGGIKRNTEFSSILNYLQKQNLTIQQNGKHITIISK